LGVQTVKLKIKDFVALIMNLNYFYMIK